MRHGVPAMLGVAACVAALTAGCGHPLHGAETPPSGVTSVTPGSRPTSIQPSAASPSTAPSTPRPTTGTTGPPAFTWHAAPLDPATRGRMDGVSWRAACPVPLDQLRLVTLTYWGFDHAAHQGNLVVNAGSVAPIVTAFRSIYGARFPVRQMRLVDDFAGDDERSMAADNTSAFNCRLVPGTATWSQHAYGRAVDIDPLENPEVNHGQVDPPSAAPWADRTRSDPGMIRHGDAVWRAFAAVGWAWGGDWRSLSDYQHFSANGL